MEKTYKRVPFDIELAKKITIGDIDGRIVNDTGHLVRIICFDARNDKPIVALIILSKSNTEVLRDFNLRGANFQYNDYLYLEFPEESPKHEFKPFDRVLVRQSDNDVWRVALYSHFNSKENLHVTAWLDWYQCIPYEGNEHLVGTSNKQP